MIKTYLTINDKFFIPNLIHYLRSYIRGCHVCQLNRNEKPPSIQLQTRIDLNSRHLSRLSIDLKAMPRSSKAYKFMLCVIVLYNILLLINHYIHNSTTKCHSRSMSDNRDLTETFLRIFLHIIRSLHQSSRYFQSS